MRRAEAREAKQSQAAEGLDEMEPPLEGGAWITDCRRSACARVREMGLPSRRDEYWRFTRPDAFITTETSPARRLEADEMPVFGGVDPLKIVFVDGKLDLQASDALAGEGLEIETLEEAGAHDIHWVKDLFGVLETRAQTPVERPFAALNTATATEGVVIRVTGKAERHVNLQYMRGNDAADASLHQVLRIE